MPFSSMTADSLVCNIGYGARVKQELTLSTGNLRQWRGVVEKRLYQTLVPCHILFRLPSVKRSFARYAVVLGF